MKKSLSFILSLVLIFSGVLSINAFSIATTDKICSYKNYKGETIFYYKQPDGDTYVIENGKKEYVAIPVSIEKITDEVVLKELRENFNKAMANANPTRSSTYTKTMDFTHTIDSTGILTVSGSYLYIKCSNLNPSNGTRGFSFYVRYSPDGTTWYQNQYINYSLLIYRKLIMADFGNGPYIQIRMWSYYGDVNSCLMTLKASYIG